MRRSISRSILVLIAVRSLAACAGESPTVARPEVPPFAHAATPSSPITALPVRCRRDLRSPDGVRHSRKLALRHLRRGSVQSGVQQAGLGFFEYRGHYSRADSSIVFSFDGWSIAGPWLATGIVRRDSSIVVRYNVIMQLSDFEDGVYKSGAPLSSKQLRRAPF